MPSFRFKAVDPTGRIVEGEMSALTGTLVASDLEARSCLPVSIVQIGNSAKDFGLSRRPRDEDLTCLTEDLAALLAAGVSLAAGLDLLRVAAPPAIATLVSFLHEEVSGGRSFAQALAKSPAFSSSFVEMVRVAEVAGTLAETLSILARERRRSAEIRSRVRSALAYPLFLVVLACAVLIFVLVSVIPSFEQALSGIGSNGETQGFVFRLSRTVRESGVQLTVAAACVLGLAAAALRSPLAKRAARNCGERLPVLGTLVLYHRTFVFCSMLAMLMKSGVEISTSLRLIRDAMQDAGASSRHDEVLSNLRNGEHLTTSLSKVNLLPLPAIHMLRVGEEIGDLAGASARIAAAYDAKFGRALDRTTSVMGPVILLLVSALVGWIIVSVMTALLQINESLL